MEEVVPHGPRTRLHHPVPACGAAEAQQQADEVRASATASYAVLVGQAKKRRADFDEACMGMDA